MRGDITDNLSIAYIIPAELINLLSINPTKIKMFFLSSHKLHISCCSLFEGNTGNNLQEACS